MHPTKKKQIGRIISFSASTGLLLYFCMIGIENILRYNKFKQEYKAILEGYNLSLKINQIYKESINATKTPDFWEVKAKKQLGFIKNGETLYRVIPKQ